MATSRNSRTRYPEGPILEKVWEKYSMHTMNRSYGGFYGKRDWTTPKLRETTPWVTTNSEYGRSVQRARERVEQRLGVTTTGSEAHTQQQLEHRRVEQQQLEQRQREQQKQQQLGELSIPPTPRSSKHDPSPSSRLSQNPMYAQYYRASKMSDYSSARGAGGVPSHRGLPPVVGGGGALSSSRQSSYSQRSTEDLERRIERLHYVRRNPPSGLGKRFMNDECRRLWSNMGRLSRENSASPSVNILTIEREAENEQKQKGDEGEGEKKGGEERGGSPTGEPRPE